MIGTNDDKYLGTDWIYRGLRYDITINPEKTFCKKVGNYSIPGIGTNVIIGVRYGNGVVRFKEPVIVLLIDEEMSILRSFEENIVSSFIKAFESIAEKAEDLYWETVDA